MGRRYSSNNAAKIDLSQEIEITVQQEPLKVGSLPPPAIEWSRSSRDRRSWPEPAAGQVTVRQYAWRQAVARVGQCDDFYQTGGGRSSTAGDPRLKLGGMLDIDGLPLGAGKAIRPPHLAIPDARFAAEPGRGAVAPLEIKLDAPISDVAVGGGGRFLLSTQKDAHKLAIFDVNAAADRQDNFSSFLNRTHCRRANKFLIVFPDEKLLQRWNLETIERKVGTRPTPIDGRIKAVAMGADSQRSRTRPLGRRRQAVRGQQRLVQPDRRRIAFGVESGVDGPCRLGVLSGHRNHFSSGGAFMVDASASERTWTHLRASAGRLALRRLGSSSAWPSGFHCLPARRGSWSDQRIRTVR